MKISTNNSNDPQIIASNLMIDMSEYKYIREMYQLIPILLTASFPSRIKVSDDT
jgi:hypothetical protein